MTNFVKAHYRGAFRVIMGGVPMRIARLPVSEGGRELMRQSSREMCLPLPPRGKADRLKWECQQLAKFKEADKLGDRAIDDVVTPLRASAPAPAVEPVEPVTAPAPSVEPGTPAPIAPQFVRVPVRPRMTPRIDRATMAGMKTVNYYRVSTARQGRSGLGLEAQRASVEAFCAGRGCHVMGEFTEIESGKNDARPQLAAALHLAKVTGSTLVIAKLDRLSRNVSFLAALQDAGVRFLCADMPEASELTLHIMAAMAQAERKAISTRTRDALAVAKARGVKLGNPRAAEMIAENRKNSAAPRLAAIQEKADSFAADVLPIIEAVQISGHTSLRQIANELNRRGIMTVRGKPWGPQVVSDVIKRAKGP